MDRHRKRCDLTIGYIVSPALDNAQRTVFLEDGCRLVGVLLELLAVGSRHCGYESVNVGHDVSPVTSGCSVTLAIYCPLKRFSRPLTNAMCRIAGSSTVSQRTARLLLNADRDVQRRRYQKIETMAESARRVGSLSPSLTDRKSTRLNS